MNTLLENVFTILTSSPENLVYHLVLVFAIMAAFQSVMVLQRKSEGKQARRMMLGLAVLLLGQIVLFVASAFTWQGLANPQLLLPPIDRAVTIISLTWAVWLWAFPKPTRLADALVAVVSLVVVILLIVTFVLWNQNPLTSGFNTSLLDTGWNALGTFLVFAGLLVLVIQRGEGWGMGTSFLLLHLAGFLAHFVWAKTGGDYSAPLRLAMLCAYPLLPSLVQHLQPAEVKSETPQVVETPAIETPIPVVSASPDIERRRYTADPRSSYTWLQLAAEEESQHVPYAMARAIAQSMVSDLCILVSSPPHGMINLESGYDLIQEEELAPAALPQKQMPALHDALTRGETLIINNSSDSIDPALEQMGATIGLDQPGNLMLIPITGKNIQASGIMLMSPYSNREWTHDDQTYLAGLSELISQILEKEQHKPISKTTPLKKDSDLQQELAITLSSLSAMQKDMEESHIKITSLTQELEKAKEDARSFKADLDNAVESHTDLERKLAEARQKTAELDAENKKTASLAKKDKQAAVSAEIAKQAEELEIARSSLEQLSLENENLRRDLESARAEGPELDEQFRATLEESARLKNSLAQANTRIAQFESQASGPAPLTSSDQKTIIALGQELRQPLASIVGYSDLLLSEKTGILGALQHRLMLRVKQSTKRMTDLLDDINSIINRSGDRETSVVAVDFNAIVDKTIAKVGNGLRDKNIALHFDLPDNIPSVHVDEDSMEQVIFYLMQNAILATPKEGEISLHVNIEDEADQPHFLIQIKDSGGGIAMEDLPRVFSRTYLEDHPEINGLGDQGVGLSIAKTLTEAHQGRIWVESEKGNTSTFSVLFPFRVDEDEGEIKEMAAE
jgi:signal transduction histidine kinase